MKKQSEECSLKPTNFKILNKNQREVLKNLSFTKKFNFYLAGGTGLSLYLAHRTSTDFDFYTYKRFKNLSIYFKEGEVVNDLEDTFEIIVKNVSISFFYYPYSLIREPFQIENIKVASIEDISAMKMISITQRGNFRDFLDIYFLIRKFGLKKLINWTKEKYSNYSIFLILKGLLYFKDADRTAKENEKRIKLLEDVKWNKIKELIKKEVKAYVEGAKNGG